MHKNLKESEIGITLLIILILLGAGLILVGMIHILTFFI